LLIDVNTAATMLGISPRTVWRLVTKGELAEPVHIGRLARWQIIDILAFVDLLREQVVNRPASTSGFDQGSASKS
jgi:predicted DNA-binding transcriptional regulator AlpA